MTEHHSATTDLQPVANEPGSDAKITIPVTLLLSLAGAILTLLLFTWMAREVLEGDAEHFDLVVRNWVHQFASPAMTRVMTDISLLGQQLLIAEFLAAMIVFLALKWRKAAAWLVIAVAGALVLEISLKLVFQRPRPPAFFGVLPSGYSFPSGHALVSFCFYGVIAGLLADRTKSLLLEILVWVSAACLVLVIGLSRVYLGVHHPTDVLAGFLAAGIWVTSIVALDHIRLLRRRRNEL